jgi:ribonuclease HI
MTSHYAVAKGKTVGIFSTWNECQEQVKGIKGAVYKKFSSKVT